MEISKRRGKEEEEEEESFSISTNDLLIPTKHILLGRGGFGYRTMNTGNKFVEHYTRQVKREYSRR
jgi:hypothetical protein